MNNAESANDESPARIASVLFMPHQVSLIKKQEEDWNAELAAKMEGPPMEIHLKEGAIPKKVIMPATIPGNLTATSPPSSRHTAAIVT